MVKFVFCLDCAVVTVCTDNFDRCRVCENECKIVAIIKSFYNEFSCVCGCNWNTPVPIVSMKCKECGMVGKSKTLPIDFQEVEKNVFDMLNNDNHMYCPVEEYMDALTCKKNRYYDKGK